MKRMNTVLDAETIRLAKEISAKGQITDGIRIALELDLAHDFEMHRMTLNLDDLDVSKALRAGGKTVSVGIRNQILAAHNARSNPDRKRIARMVAGMADLIAEFNEAGL